ncbi:MAG: glycerophosphodiester phosphodiesterase family protein, partial [Spirochaetota bacterium]|nr:glycerophosphodiester phosphodiesterase family protein [Spirochaetota bacterium]
MRRKNRNTKPFTFAGYPLLFGHRGCSKLAPENTLAAFQEVLDNNIPGLELDVHLCKSGEIVVCHDLNLKRTTGCDSLISETSLDDIKKLDAGSWFDKSFAGEKIPTLDEVFKLMGTRVYYDIEIKHRNKHYGELEKKLTAKIKEWKFENRVIISSFNPIAILGIRKEAPMLNTAVIYTKWKELPWYLRTGGGKYICKPNILKPTRHQINPRTMFINKKIEGYPVITWTEDDIEKAEKYINMGVDGIVTNVPENMLDMVRKRWD